MSAALAVTRAVNDRKSGHARRPCRLCLREGAAPGCGDIASWGAVTDWSPEVAVMDGLVLHAIIAGMGVIRRLIGDQSRQWCL